MSDFDGKLGNIFSDLISFREPNDYKITVGVPGTITDSTLQQRPEGMALETWQAIQESAKVPPFYFNQGASEGLSQHTIDIYRFGMAYYQNRYLNTKWDENGMARDEGKGYPIYKKDQLETVLKMAKDYNMNIDNFLNIVNAEKTSSLDTSTPKILKTLATIIPAVSSSNIIATAPVIESIVPEDFLQHPLTKIIKGK